MGERASHGAGACVGVRLFAYRSRKKELSCEELAHGKARGRQRAEVAAQTGR